MILSYCTNIHPFDSWEKSVESITECVPRIRKNLQLLDSSLSHSLLGIGLRLSSAAAASLIADSREITKFRNWMNKNNCCVETINGFPFGNFYSTKIKENVFRPDWADQERVEYTKNIACILSLLMPEHLCCASISTVPVSHSSFLVNEKNIVHNLDTICSELHLIEERSGKRIILGLEPEPMGYIDTTQGVIDFFTRIKTLSARPSLIEKYLGITYDTCHFAVMGESPSFTLSSWEDEKIPLSKIQFSNALELYLLHFNELETLAPFVEPIYSHQTSIRFMDGSFRIFADLPQALVWATANRKSVENTRWTIHYHIPLFTSPSPPLANTSTYNEETIKWLLERATSSTNSPQLEVETYTWSTLPLGIKKHSIPVQIAMELNWINDRITSNSKKQIKL